MPLMQVSGHASVAETSSPVANGGTPAAAMLKTRRRSHFFYLVLTAVLIGTVVRGFWPSYFGALWEGRFNAHWIMHLHGAVFTGWMVLLLALLCWLRSGASARIAGWESGVSRTAGCSSAWA